MSLLLCKKKLLKKCIAFFLSVTMISSIALPTRKVEAGIVSFVATKASTVVMTVMGRQFVKAMKNYGQTDKVGSSVAEYIYKYKAGPTGTTLNALVNKTNEISNQIKELDEHLTQVEDSVLSGIQDIEGILEQQEVTNQYTRVSQIPTYYSRASQAYNKLVSEMSENGSDMNSDGQVDEVDMKIITDRYEQVYQMLPERDFADDMTEFAGIVSDTEGNVSVEADVTGNHFKNDATYIKAVKTCTQQAVPFASQVSLATTYAGMSVFEQQSDLITLYAEMMWYLDGVLQSEELSEMKRLAYQRDYDRLSNNYEAVYNMTMNAMNNAAEQMESDKMMSYKDETYIDPVSGMTLYQMQMNRPITEGIEYTTGGIYYIPTGTLKTNEMFEFHSVGTSEDNPHSSLPTYVTMLKHQPSDTLNKLMRRSVSDNNISLITAPSQAKELFGTYMLNAGGSMNSISYLKKYGAPIGDAKYTLYNIDNERIIDSQKDKPIITYERIDTYSNELKTIENSIYDRNVEDDDTEIIESKDFYESKETFTVMLKNNSEKPNYSISYTGDSKVDASGMPSNAEAGSIVKFKLNGFACPQYFATATAKRANGEEIILNLIETANNEGYDTYEFIMPFNDVVIDVQLHENRSKINKESKNGSIICSDSALWGDTVELKFEDELGYKFSECVVTKASGEVVEVNGNKFVMPKEDVYVKATFLPVASYSGILSGEGTKENPYKIGSVAEWNALAESVIIGSSTSGMYFEISTHIAMKNEQVVMLGTKENPFDGTLLGNDYIIGGFSNIKGNEPMNALIAYTGENAYIEKITFMEAVLSTPEKTNTIFGVNHGTIKDCLSAITTEVGTGAGIAYENYGTIENCIFGGYIMNGGEGIVSANYGNVIGCKNQGVGYNLTGGICGSNEGVIDHCVNESDMSNRDNVSSSFIGGIAAINSKEGIIINCGNRGNVGIDKANYVGGLVGLLSGGKIVNSYNLGNVIGEKAVGGLAGCIAVKQNENGEAMLSICYSNGNVSSKKDFKEGHIGSAIGMVVSAKDMAVSKNVEDITGLVSKVFVNVDNNADTIPLIANYDNNNIADGTVKYISVIELKSNGFFEKLNEYVAEYNNRGRGRKATYWTNTSSEDSLPVHVDMNSEDLGNMNNSNSTDNLDNSDKLDNEKPPVTGDSRDYIVWIFMAGMALVVMKLLNGKTKEI